MRSFVRRALSFALVLAIVISGSLAPGRSVALSESRLDAFAQNNILFYDPEGAKCIPRSKISPDSPYRPDEGGWYWNGSCSSLSSRYIELLNRDFDYIKAAADSAGVPWELIPAQAMQESQWGDSAVYRQCNNPLGIKGGNCAGPYARYNSIEEAYVAHTRALAVQEVVATGLYSSSPYSFLEYMQYGGTYSYAVCEPGYAVCEGVPDGYPTPGYVQSVSSFICAIQKWAEENGKPTSAETYANFVDPKIDTKLGGSIDGLDFVGPTASKTAYCPPGSDNYDWGEGGMRIANVAVELAWPYQVDNTCGVDHEYPDWWPNNKTKCNKITKPEFAEAKAATGDTYGDDTDCGHFVSVVVRYSGVDPELPPYQVTWMGGIYGHFQESPLWEEVTDVVNQNSANLLPGDVFHSHGCGHTLIYVGDIPAKTYGGDVAQASAGGHTGDLRQNGIQFTRSRHSSEAARCPGDTFYHIYRYVGDGGEVEVIDTEQEESNV